MLITAVKVAGGGDAVSPASSATARTTGGAVPPPAAAAASLSLGLVGVGATRSLIVLRGRSLNVRRRRRR